MQKKPIRKLTSRMRDVLLRLIGGESIWPGNSTKAPRIGHGDHWFFLDRRLLSRLLRDGYVSRAYTITEAGRKAAT